MSPSPMQSLLPRRQTEIDLLAWLGQAAAGDVIEYHQGFLALDRSPYGDAFQARDRAAIGQVANQALRLADHGLVHLLQRRIRSERFSYLAIARPRNASSPLPLPASIPEEKA